MFTQTNSQFTDPHWRLSYYNIFDASYDAVWQALNKLGYGDLTIVVGECGWPSWEDGNPPDQYREATIQNAQAFNQNLINHCKSGKGTPKNSNRQIPCFVFEMYDEDTKDINPGEFERHWGVYEAAAKAKFNLSW